MKRAKDLLDSVRILIGGGAILAACVMRDAGLLIAPKSFSDKIKNNMKQDVDNNNQNKVQD